MSSHFVPPEANLPKRYVLTLSFHTQHVSRGLNLEEKMHERRLVPVLSDDPTYAQTEKEMLSRAHENTVCLDTLI